MVWVHKNIVQMKYYNYSLLKILKIKTFPAEILKYEIIE